MKTEEEILDRLHAAILLLGTDAGHMASVRLGWVNALEWVLGRDV